MKLTNLIRLLKTQKQSTIFVVSNAKDILDNCDYILNLEQGSIKSFEKNNA